MSRDFNRVILLGRLARDPEVKFPAGGQQKAARFTICTGRQWKNRQTGEQQSHTDFINVTTWGAIAEVIEKYVRKGSPLLVEGRISTRDYVDKTGARRYVTEVTAENITLLGGEAGARREQPQTQPQTQPTAGGYSARSDESSAFDDNFPLDFSDLGGGDTEIPF